MAIDPSSLDGACTVTLLTPSGRGAVATIAVEGPGSVAAVHRFFRPITSVAGVEFPIGRILVGHWQSTNAASEEVVVCRRAKESVEVNCHGGQAAWQAILDSLLSVGAQRSEPETWLTQRGADAVQQAAWLALRHAATPRVASILLDQFRGALRTRLNEILEISEFLEAADVDCATQQLERLLAHADVGRHLTQPWRIVFAGPPNVGKSSLVNALLGYERAIVYDQPGTTRDVLSAGTAFDGWPVELVDTAGLRNTSDAIEAEGVLRSRAEIAKADLVAFVVDHETTDFNQLEWVPSATQIVTIANKTDLSSGILWKIPSHWLRTSAVTGLGLPQLMQVLVERLVPHPPTPGEAVPFTAEQVASLQALLEAVRGGELAHARHFAEGIITSQPRSGGII
jgi:tRNA modification GTPase